MIFAFYPKVAVKLGEERYEFDRASLMFTEVAEMETVSGYSYGEWEADLRRYSIRAVAALVHVLRKRAGVASDFETMNFSADDLDVVPLHDDGAEYTAAEVAADISRRLEEAKDPTGAAGTAAPNGAPTPDTAGTASTSPISPNGTASARLSGKSSPGGTSSGSKQTRTRT